jgi:hypothetical protein
MALIVQDDTGGVLGANGYITNAFFKSYHINQGVSDVVNGNIDDVNIDSAIIRATTYIDSRFGAQLKGCKWKKPSIQTTEFPRLHICDGSGFDISEIIPIVLMKATAEYTLFAVNNTLTLTPSTDETGQIIKSKKEKVGPLEEETEFHGGSTGIVGIFKRIPQADLIMRELLNSVGRVIRG